MLETVTKEEQWAALGLPEGGGQGVGEIRALCMDLLRLFALMTSSTWYSLACHFET